jgi:hypothetical protein
MRRVRFMPLAQWLKESASRTSPTVVDEIAARWAGLARPSPLRDDAPRRRDVPWLEPQLLAEVGYAETSCAIRCSGLFAR